VKSETNSNKIRPEICAISILTFARHCLLLLLGTKISFYASHLQHRPPRTVLYIKTLQRNYIALIGC